MGGKPFTINLELGTAPILKVPYRFVLAKMVDLNVDILWFLPIFQP